MSDHRDHHTLEHIEHALKKLVEKIHHMSTEIDNLKAQVATTIQLETQAIALLKSGSGGLPASDLAQVVLLTNQLKTSSDALAAVLNGGGGGSSTESTNAQTIVTSAQQVANVATNPAQVQTLLDQMQAAAANLSAAFTANTPPLSAAITQQEIAGLQAISTLLSELSTVINDSNQVAVVAGEIQSAATALATIIRNNPRGAPVRRTLGR